MNRTPLRVKLAAGILCGVFVLSLLAFADVEICCTRLRRETESVLSLLDSGAEDTALGDAVAGLDGMWARYDLPLRLALSGEALADLNEAIARMPAQTGDPDELRAALLSVAAELRFLCRQERTVI